MPPAEREEPAPIAVVGAGHVGLVTAAGFTHHGIPVRVGEADPERLAILEGGGVPFHEEGLPELVDEARRAGLLTFHASNAEAARDAAAVFVAVPTPPGEGGAADLSRVEAAIGSLAGVTTEGTAVVIKSSVPPGSWRSIAAWMEAAGCRGSLVINPEFLQEGKAVEGVLAPARVVIGSADPAAAGLVAALHEPMGAPVVCTDPASAELIKYAANAYLAMRVSFINGIANLADEVGADIFDVAAGIGADPRIGRRFLSPGPGYGGSCFPKDLPALVEAAAGHGLDLPLVRAVIEVNEQQPARVVAKAAAALGTLQGRRVALLGLAFKAGTDDTSSSPAVRVAGLLVQAGAAVRAYDPQAAVAMEGVQQVGSVSAAIDGADAVVIATEWPEFAALDPTAMAEAMAGRVVVDARNVMDREAARAAGLDYRGVGR